MKKNVIILLAIFVSLLLIITIIFIMQISSMKDVKKQYDTEVEFFKKYEDTQFDVNDFISMMNKAIENNEKYEIKKDKNNLYIEDDKYSIKIYLKLDDSENLVPMEKLMLSEEGGALTINRLFSDIIYKIEDIEYHQSTKRVKKITIYGFTTGHETEFSPHK